MTDKQFMQLAIETGVNTYPHVNASRRWVDCTESVLMQFARAVYCRALDDAKEAIGRGSAIHNETAQKEAA